MDIIEGFLAQHQKIVLLGKDFKAYCTEENINKYPILVKEMQDKLNRVLQMHLRLEDSSFYPQLNYHDDPVIRETSQKLHQEGLRCTAKYTQYQKRYQEITSITKDPKAYIIDTHNTVDLIIARVKKEESELFPLFK